MNQTRTPTESRRSKVYDMLLQGLDDKILMGGTDPAVRLLETAYKLARTPQALIWPFPQLTAYRLAYILMRSARTSRDLQRVDALLTEAAGGRSLDPLQHALHIMVIERLRDQARKVADRDELRLRAGANFQRLAAATREAEQVSMARPVQNDLFNIVELCAFLIEGDFGLLDGRSRLAAPLLPEGTNDGFALIGTGGIDHQVRWTPSLARGEFQARLSEGGVDLAFECVDTPVLIHPHRRQIPLVVGDHFPEFILGQDLALDVADANNFNVSLKKARQTIAEMLEPVRGRQLGHKEVIGSKGNKQYQFHPELRVLGLVGGRHLRALSRI